MVGGHSDGSDGLSSSQRTILDALLAREEARFRRSEARAVRDEARAERTRSGVEFEHADALRRAAARGEIDRVVHEIEGLMQALSTRTVIANAVGLLMGQGGSTRAEAFNQLRLASQRTNRPIRDIAAELVGQHERRALRTRPEAAPGTRDERPLAGPVD